MGQIIAVSDLCKQYHKQTVLDHVNMTISKGGYLRAGREEWGWKDNAY